MDVARLKPVTTKLGDSPEDSAMLFRMAQEAKEFIESFEWCRCVNHQFFGLGVGGVIGAFLLNIAPAKPEADDWLWVIVGDLPPAYIVTDDAPTAIEAVEAYVREMREWAEAAKSGNPVDDLIPVNVPPTPEYGAELERRLEFIEKNILSRKSG